MDVDDADLLVNTQNESNSAQNMETRSLGTSASYTNFVPDPNEDIKEKSVNKPNTSVSDNTEVIKETIVNNNTEGNEGTTIHPDIPYGEYMDKDEYIQSILEEPCMRPSGSYVEECMSSPENSEHSEFDISDDKNDFELWSSDASSADADARDDPEAVGVEGDETISELVSKTSDKLPANYWKDIQQETIQRFEFTGNPQATDFDHKEKLTPLQCFKLFVNDEVIHLLVQETNKFARSKFVRPGYHKDFLTGWIDVTSREMRQFIGLLIYMTLRRFPGTKYYWSGDKDFGDPVAGRIMTETRFKRLLTFWYFGNDKENYYAKIRNLLNVLNDNLRRYREPGRVMYVGKATLFLRDKYAFQRHLIGTPKRGQRLLRLLDSEIYTYKVLIMPPVTCNDRIDKTKQLALNLLENYLNKGRQVVFHNLFISVDMAQELLRNKTHIIGPIRKKARNTPAELRKLKVKNNEVRGFQNPEGISVVKWKMWGQACYGVSTCHGTETVQVEKLNKRDGKTVVKEQARFLRDLSNSDKVFDLAEKYSVTESPVNNETTWYRRMANDLLTGTCVSNAFCVYKKINNEKIKFCKFQDQLWKELVGYRSTAKASSEDTSDEEDES